MCFYFIISLQLDLYYSITYVLCIGNMRTQKLHIGKYTPRRVGASSKSAPYTAPQFPNIYDVRLIRT